MTFPITSQMMRRCYVLLRDEVHFHPARAQVIGEGQGALPALRHARPLHRPQNGRGIVIAEGDGDDVGLIAVRPLHVGDAGRIGQIERGSDAGSFGIAWILEEILHRAALHAGFRPPGADGPGVAFGIAVVLRVGVENDANSAALLGQVDFDAAEVGAVAADHDLAVEVDVLAVEFIEVFDAPVIRVDDLAGYVA